MDTSSKRTVIPDKTYRFLLERVPFPVALVAPDGKITFLNERFVQVFGFSSSDIPSVADWWILAYPDPEYRSWVTKTWNEAIDQARELNTDIESIEYSVTCKNGSVRQIMISGITLNEGLLATFIDVSERSRLEAKLKMGNEQLLTEKQYTDHLIDSLPGLFYQISPEGKFTRWNKNFENITGYSHDDVSDLSPLDLFDGADKEEIQSRIREVFLQGSSSAEAILRSKTGSACPYSFSGKQIVIGNTPYLVGLGLDISDIKQAQEALKSSEEKFRLAFDKAVIGKAMADMEMKFIKVNPAFCRMLGYQEKEMLGKTWMEITLPEFLPICQQMAANLLSGKETSVCFDSKFINKTGTSLWVNLNAILLRDEHGQPFCFIGDVVNVDDQKRIMNELDYRNQVIHKFLTVRGDEIYHLVLQILLNAMESPYGVFGYINLQGDLVVPSMTRHIWDECHIPEKNIVFPRDTWGDSSWPRAIREKRSNYSNIPSTNTPQGHIAVTRHISVPIIHLDQVIGLIQVANKPKDYTQEDVDLLQTIANSIAPILAARLERDVEETLRTRAESSLEEKVIELERSNRELEQFAYVASHDLQEPLRMISSYTQLLERRYKDRLDQDATEFIGFAVDGATRLQRLINDLLDYSRVTTKGKPFTKVDLMDVLSQVMINLKERIQETGALITNEELPFVQGDESQLIRLFQNLIDNALKFKGRDTPMVRLTSSVDQGVVTVSIRDNGIGVDPKFSDQIFTIFKRLHTQGEYPGTGIGLAICKRIVERHGGAIRFTSTPGEGTTFLFTLNQSLRS